jgi:hypothetical protein
MCGSRQLVCLRCVTAGSWAPLPPAGPTNDTQTDTHRRWAHSKPDSCTCRTPTRTTSFAPPLWHANLHTLPPLLPLQLYHLGVPPGHFTHVLMDEAGHAEEPLALAATAGLLALDGR